MFIVDVRLDGGMVRQAVPRSKLMHVPEEELRRHGVSVTNQKQRLVEERGRHVAQLEDALQGAQKALSRAGRLEEALREALGALGGLATSHVPGRRLRELELLAQLPLVRAVALDPRNQLGEQDHANRQEHHKEQPLLEAAQPRASERQPETIELLRTMAKGGGVRARVGRARRRLAIRLWLQASPG